MAATYTNFCARSGGSNLNAGTLTGDTTEPGTAPSFAYDGTFATNTFTVTAGRQGGSTTDPSADGVVAGQFVHVNDGAAVGRLARISSVTSTTIVLDTTATVGSGTGAVVANVGGAFLGPNAAVPFIDTYPAAVVSNVADDPVRINLKSDQTYSITASISLSTGDVVNIFGYTSSYGDGGKAILDGGTSGASYALLAIGASSSPMRVESIEFRNNGATGSVSGVTVAGTSSSFFNCVIRDFRGTGIASTATALSLSECEVYGCNQSNTANLGGITSTTSISLNSCIVHDNTGTNAFGLRTTGSVTVVLVDSVFDSNGTIGGVILTGASATPTIIGCDFYANVGPGVNIASVHSQIKNSNFIDNGTYGVLIAAGSTCTLLNCGFGSGTAANASGATSGNVNEIGSVTYAADVTPYGDPADGNFSITLAAAQGTGRGTFLQTQTGYGAPSPTLAYPDIGAGQSDAGAGSGTVLLNTGMNGGCI